MSRVNDTTDREADRGRNPPTAIGLLDRRAMNLPNLITASRLILAFVLFLMIYVDGLWLSAAVLFVLAASTDALDGYIARRYGLITPLGRMLDPFVDKIIVCGAFIFLLEKHTTSGVNAWMVTIVIAREMLVTGLRSFLEQRGKDFSASTAGKIKMLLQCTAVTASLLSLSPSIASPAFDFFRDILLWLAIGVTIYSGYVYVRRAVQMLQIPGD